MSNNAEDSVVIMTGAAGGLGAVLARGLLAAGRRVVAVDVPTADERLAELTAEAGRNGTDARLLTLEANVRSTEECNAVVAMGRKHFGRIDVLVNCAGIGIDFEPDATGARCPRFYGFPSTIGKRCSIRTSNGPFRLARGSAPSPSQGWAVS